MKKFAFTLLSLVAIASVGCNKVTTEMPLPDTNSDAIVFTGDIAKATSDDADVQSAPTRVETTKSKTEFVAGDKIGVFVVPFKNSTTRGDLIANGNYADNVPFVRDAAGQFAPTAADRITFPNAKTHVSIYAFAMYDEMYNTLGADPKSQDWIVAADQTGAAGVDIIKNDLMTAQQLDVAPTSVPNLEFRHRLAMVRANIKTLDTYRGGKVTSASLVINNVITEAKVNMTDNTVPPVTHGSTSTPIKAYQFSSTVIPTGGLDCVYEAVVVPQTVAAGKVGVTITLVTTSPNGSFDFKCEFPAAVLYSSGNVTTITLTFDKEYNLTLNNVSIAPWGDGGSTDVVARQPAIMNFKVDTDPFNKAASIRYAVLGIDNDQYVADVVYDSGSKTLRGTYMQPKNKVGDKLKSLTLQDASKAIVGYQNALPAITSAGVNIPGNPTLQGYAEIISTLTFN